MNMKTCCGGFGLLNVDLLYSGLPRFPQEGEEIFADAFSLQLGGGVAATLIGLRRLGVPAELHTFIGSDLFSTFAASSLERFHIPVFNYYDGSEIPVNISSAIITKRDRSIVSYNGVPSGDAALPDWLWPRMLERFSGYRLVEMQPYAPDFYRELHRRGVTLVLDTGWSDELSLEKFADYLEIADYYTPNEKEALKLTGCSSVEAAACVLEPYFKSVVVKQGAEGCLLRENGVNRFIQVLPNVQAVDATGAGDAFLSGFLYGLYHNYSVTDAVQFGNICGGFCVSSVGCLGADIDESLLLETWRDVYHRSVD